MKFSGKMCLMIILKITKNQGLTLSLEDIFFGKPQGRSQIDSLLPQTVLGLRTQGKNVERKMDSFFEHRIFDKAREKVLSFIRQLEKPEETFESSLYTCFKCGSNKIFSIAKQVRSADEGTSVFNKCRECHNEWRNG